MPARRPRAAFLQVEPNPARRTAAVRIRGLEDSEGLNLCVLDAGGRIVVELPLSRPAMPVGLDLRTLDAGVYMVRLSAGDFATTHKLVVTW